MKYFIVFIAMVFFLTACSSNGAEKKTSVRIVKHPHIIHLAAIEKAGLSSTIKLPAQFAALSGSEHLSKSKRLCENCTGRYRIKG